MNCEDILIDGDDISVDIEDILMIDDDILIKKTLTHPWIGVVLMSSPKMYKNYGLWLKS